MRFVFGGDRLGLAFIVVSEIPVWARSGEPRNNDGDGIVIISIQDGVRSDGFEKCQLLSARATQHSGRQPG
jgi:hypothetical protein